MRSVARIVRIIRGAEHPYPVRRVSPFFSTGAGGIRRTSNFGEAAAYVERSKRAGQRSQFGSCHILVNRDSVPRQSLASPRCPPSPSSCCSCKEKGGEREVGSLPRSPSDLDGWTDSRTSASMRQRKI